MLEFVCSRDGREDYKKQNIDHADCPVLLHLVKYQMLASKRRTVLLSRENCFWYDNSVEICTRLLQWGLLEQSQVMPIAPLAK